MKLLILLAAAAMALSTMDADACTRIRDPKQRAAFMKLHPCPANGHTSGACPGYVVDHKKALACHGADRPYNMQWQTTAEGKAKDKIETKGCKT